MQAVWAKTLLKEKNITITFQCRVLAAENTILYLVASNLYRLFVNGKMVGYGPARAAHGYSRVDSYSLEKWSGQNVVISVEVYSANVNTYYVVDELPFFAAEVKTGEKIVATSMDFLAYHMTERVQKVRRFSFQRTFTEIYHLNRNPELFYAGDTDGRTPLELEKVEMNQLLPRYVKYPKLNKQHGNVIEYGVVGVNANVEPWRDRAYLDVNDDTFKGFYPSEIEEDSGEEAGKFTYVAGKIGQTDGKSATFSSMSYHIYDFGRTITGFFSLRMKVKKDSTLYILFDEVVTKYENHTQVSPFRNKCCNVLKYTMTCGDYHVISFEANSARYATVVVTDGFIEMDEFGMILYENPDAEMFEYDYGDEKLNRIVAAAVHTLAQNAVDVLTDCPSRERAGWLCDSYFAARAEYLFTGNNLVEKSFLENYALCPQSDFLPKGMLPMCYPADHKDERYIPNWPMWYILELRNYWKRTGDDAMRLLSKQKVYGLVGFFEKYYNEYGLLENLESWVFVEHSKCNDDEYIKGVNFPSNMLWAKALETVAELYDDSKLAHKARDIRKVIRELSWNGEFFEDNAIRDGEGKLIQTGHTTETCQYYAFYFDVASRDEYSELFDKMKNQFGPKRDASIEYPTVYPSNAIVGNYLRLEILMRYGFTEQVLTECCDFFDDMAVLTGTLWEHSRLTASLNHGFASVAAVYIDECMRRI